MLRVKLHTGGWENGKLGTVVGPPDNVPLDKCSALTFVIVDGADGKPRGYGSAAIKWLPQQPERDDA